MAKKRGTRTPTNEEEEEEEDEMGGGGGGERRRDGAGRGRHIRGVKLGPR